MTGVTTKKYRIERGVDIEKYVGAYCGSFPDSETINLLENLSTKSLVKAHIHAKNNEHFDSYYSNLKQHLFALLQKRNNIINGIPLYDFEDDSHLELHLIIQASNFFYFFFQLNKK